MVRSLPYKYVYATLELALLHLDRVLFVANPCYSHRTFTAPISYCRSTFALCTSLLASRTCSVHDRLHLT